MELGYSFIWEAYKNPFWILPNGTVIDIKSIIPKAAREAIPTASLGGRRTYSSLVGRSALPERNESTVQHRTACQRVSQYARADKPEASLAEIERGQRPGVLRQRVRGSAR